MSRRPNFLDLTRSLDRIFRLTPAELARLEPMEEALARRAGASARDRDAIFRAMAKASKPDSATLAAVRRAVLASGKTLNALAVEADINRQTVHEILVNGRGDETLARFEKILAVIGKRLVVADRKVSRDT